MHNKKANIPKLTCLLFTFSILFYSCLNTNKSTSSAKTNGEIIFNLTTTSCMGECPVIDLTIYSDSTITFIGKENTNLSGTYNKTISGADYGKVFEQINSVQWSKLQNKYTSNMMDLPSYKFFIKLEDDVKTIHQYGLEPKELNLLVKNLISIVDDESFFN